MAMESILTDQLEWLLSGNMEGTRFKRQIVLLAGCLADEDLPDEINRQITNLCRRIGHEEVFESLLGPLNMFLRNAKGNEAPALDLNSLMAQIESTRQALIDCEPVNQALLITWILGRARDKKLLAKVRGSR
jgi:hypothetical protein